jgi:hypothetical protein
LTDTDSDAGSVADSAADDAATPNAPGSPAARSRGGGLLAIAAVVLAALVVAATLLGLRDHHDQQLAAAQRTVSPAEQIALAAARGEAVALTTISYQSAAGDVRRVLAGATGALRTQFASEANQLPATLAKTKSASRGVVLSSALSSLSGDRAQALVAVDATVSGTDTGKTGVLKHYRIVVTLQRIQGKWLASDVAFAGVPQ